MTENPIYTNTKSTLRQTPRRWLVTGAAGFIGSNLVEHLLLLDQTVVGMDNFSRGKKENLDSIKAAVSPDQWEKFSDNNITGTLNMLVAASSAPFPPKRSRNMSARCATAAMGWRQWGCDILMSLDPAKVSNVL